jgi:hypothetical protein
MSQTLGLRKSTKRALRSITRQSHGLCDLQQDGIETLQRIAKQPWFDGHISELHEKTEF